MAELERKKVMIINAAVFHSGFLVGGDYFDYTIRKPGTPENDDLYRWRTEFFAVCKEFKIKPAAACIQFALRAPDVNSVALNTTDVERIKENIEFAEMSIPVEYWMALKSKGLIDTIFFEKHKMAFLETPETGIG